MNEPDYIVVRPATDFPPGLLPRHLDGRWFDLSSLPRGTDEFSCATWCAVPTGRFELREDGVIAEVYELRV